MFPLSKRDPSVFIWISAFSSVACFTFFAFSRADADTYIPDSMINGEDTIKMITRVNETSTKDVKFISVKPRSLLGFIIILQIRIQVITLGDQNLFAYLPLLVAPTLRCLNSAHLAMLSSSTTWAMRCST